MWPRELRSYADDIIKNAKAMKKSGNVQESAEVEEIAKEIEALAGSVVAAMSVEGMYCAVQLGSSESHVIETNKPL